MTLTILLLSALAGCGTSSVPSDTAIARDTAVARDTGVPSDGAVDASPPITDRPDRVDRPARADRPSRTDRPPAPRDRQGPAGDGSSPSGPYYFIAIHNEPLRKETEVAAAYPTLKEYVTRADGYGIKLTIMLGVSWSSYIDKDAGRRSEVLGWETKGHELSAHHHSPYHGSPDGYTDFDQATYAQLCKNTAQYPYVGDYAQWTAIQQQINPGVKSCCCNDERDKRVIPDVIVYDTCSGFMNYGDTLRWTGTDMLGDKGRNEYVLVGAASDGITRKWLAHSLINTDDNAAASKVEMGKMTTGVFGAVGHSAAHDRDYVLAWLDFLHGQDPTGGRSRTVTQVIEQRLLPEKAVSTADLDKIRP
jgi:hypothetical protein